MIEITNEKPLIDRIPEFLAKIDDYREYYCHNEETLDIYEGNLLPYVKKLMQATLDDRYYKLIEHRILPINFIQKFVDKLSKSYADSPLRTCEDQDFVDFYTQAMGVDASMMTAEEYTYLCKGYALKPKLTNAGKLKMDVMPLDQFMVIADDPSDKLMPTVFIEFLGKLERQYTVNNEVRVLEKDCYIAYSDTEIIGFDESGATLSEVAESLDYLNPVGKIPFVYGNRSKSNIMPKQDRDFLELSKILPLMLSDINGALMFQCFTLIYGIDVDFKDATMSPNAIWDLSSNPKSDKTAQIGTLQPTVDSTKALEFFKNILAMWLDSKGIDAGSIMQLDSQAMASGLSKAMDELDVTEARKKSIQSLAEEEKNLFSLLARMNNFWLTLPEAKDLPLRLVDVDLVDETMQIEFKEPMPRLDITTEINNSVTMLREGLSYREKEVKRLHPYMSDDEIDLVFFEYGTERYEVGDSKVEEGVEPSEEEEATEQEVPPAQSEEETAPEEAEDIEGEE